MGKQTLKPFQKHILTRVIIPATLLFLTIAGVEWFVGWKEVSKGFALISPLYLSIAMSLMLFSYVLRTWRIQASFSLHHSFLRLFKLSLTHNLLNIMMPMRTGEASFPLMMKTQFDIPMLMASLHLILFRLLDLLCLLTIGGALLFWFNNPAWSVGIVLLFVLVIICTESLKRLAVFLLARSSQPVFVKIKQTVSQLPTNGKTYFILTFLTLTSWMSKLTAFVMILLGLSDLNFTTALLGIVGADLSSVLPIHGFAGSGTFEAAFILAVELAHSTPSDSTFAVLLEASVQLHVFLIVSASLIFVLSLLMATLQQIFSRTAQSD